MTWRDTYKIHPAADVFPMMSNEELAELGEDIKKNGLREPIRYWQDGSHRLLIDGRNRLEAAERVGLQLDEGLRHLGDPIAYIISANIRRRHLTKQQQADLIVAAVTAAEKPVQVEPVSNKGGRGKKNPIKEKAVAVAKEHGISAATTKRSIAKAEGKKPARPCPTVTRDREEQLAKARDQASRDRREEKGRRLAARKAEVDEALTILGSLDPSSAQRLVNLLWDTGVHIDVQDQIDQQVDNIEFAAAEAEPTPKKKSAPKKKPAPKNKACLKCHGSGAITSKKTGTTVDCDCVRNGAALVRATP